MHGALFSLRIKLSPGLALGELTTGQTPELRVIGRYLDRIAVRRNRHPSNLCHRDDLLDVVLRGSTPNKNNAGLLPTPLEAHDLKIVQHGVVHHGGPALVKL